MDTELTMLIARGRGWQRLQRWPGVVILAAGLWSVLFGELWGLAFVAVGFWGTAENWRGVRVTGDRLVAQGRVSRRTIPLDRIRQVALDPSRTLWVQPVHGRTVQLPMAEQRVDREGGVEDIRDRLRELAREAGADLLPLPEDPQRPPRPTTPFFGW